MKKGIIAAVVLISLAFTACSGSGQKGASDSDSVKQEDSAAATDSGATPPKGASSSAAIGGFDTARAKLDTANTNPKH